MEEEELLEGGVRERPAQRDLFLVHTVEVEWTLLARGELPELRDDHRPGRSAISVGWDVQIMPPRKLSGLATITPPLAPAPESQASLR